MASGTRTETNLTFLIALTLVAVCVGGMVEIFPQLFNGARTQAVEGMLPLPALEFEGRDIYIREGCHVCHTQMVRPLRAETERYGHYSVSGEDVYEHPFLWGSKRTGPDLHSVGGKYSDEWHRLHLASPRDLVPESNMPAYPWLLSAKVDDASIAAHMTGLRRVGVPYSDAEIAEAAASVRGKAEIDALVAYLQVLGTAVK